MVIVLPVKNSAPAKTTKVRTTPNTAPCINLLKGDAAVTNGAPTLISNTTATPTYAPASMLAIAYRGRLRAWSALVRASAPASSTASDTGMGIVDSFRTDG